MIAQAAYDAALAEIATGDQIVLCDSDPTDYTDATTDADSTGSMLASASLTPGDGNGNWTIQAGDAGGESRKVTLGALTGGAAPTGNANGTATHYAIVDTATSELLYSNTMTNVAISDGVAQETQEVDVWQINEPA